MTRPALTVLVTFADVSFPVFDGPLVDWFEGKQDADTEMGAIEALGELERLYQEVSKNMQTTQQPHRNIGFEATSIKYEKLNMHEWAWVVRGYGEVGSGLVVSEDVMREAGIDWPDGCELIELNTANLMAVHDPRKRGEGIVGFEELRNSEEWEQGYDEIPY